MRTAPAPNIPPLPGMNPCEFLMAGGGGAGGAGDSASAAGDDKESTSTANDGKDAESDQKTAPDYEKYPTCGTESHPVDVVTGRVFTHPITDVSLRGPIPFPFQRSYSSSAAREDQGLGFGWGHSLGWFVQVERRRVLVWNHRGVAVEFPVPEVGHAIVGAWGWVLRRDSWGYAVDAGDDLWRVFSVTFDEGKTFKLSAIDDRNRNRIALTYEDGKLVEVVDSAGRVLRFTATDEGRVASILVKSADHQGQWIAFARYEYDEPGHLIRVTDADGHAWAYEYDEFHRLTCDTDRAGLSFSFKYDEKDRGVEAWGEYKKKRDPSLADDLPKFLADGRTRAKGVYHRKIEYHASGYTEVTDTTETRRYFGNKKGTLDKAVTGGAVTTSKYDDRGFEIEKTDPVGAVMRWVRDDRGRVLERIDPLGRRTRFERDAAGLPAEIVDAVGAVTKVWRDARGNVTVFKNAAGDASHYEHDERGNVTAVTDPCGATTRYAYDAQSNVVSVTQANGGVWALTYDAFGRRLSVTDPAGAETRYAYSDRGDCVAVYDAAGGVTRYTYDGEGHVASIRSPNGYATHFEWGGFHKLCLRRDARGETVRLAYSREGELVSIVNERGEAHTFRYDAAGRMVGERTFDGRTFRYRNDAKGRALRSLTAQEDMNDCVFDLAGQLVARLLPDGSEESYEYDARGDLVRATNAACELRFERDALGRVVREVQKTAGREDWVRVAYDGAGRRVARTTSLGHSEEVVRDAMGARVETVLDRGTRIEHTADVRAREVARTLPRGGVIESAFDGLGRVEERKVRGPAPPSPVEAGAPEWLGVREDGVTAVQAFDYDADGRLVGKGDRRRGRTQYEYDPIGQLLAAVPEKARAEVFRYDPAGNVFEGAGGPEREYARGNRLARRGDTEFVWDDAGRLVKKVEHAPGGDRVWTYAWSGAGMLDRVETPDGRSVEFAYDAFFRRVSKTVFAFEGGNRRPVARTRFVWDGHVLVHDVREDLGAGAADAAEEATYCFEDDSFVPYAQRRKRGEGGERGKRDDVGAAAPWFSFVNSPAGAPEVLVDDAGRVVWETTRGAWGDCEARRGGPASTPLRFQGQYEDEETGLTYNRARYYAPELGRFISADPVDVTGGLNVFAYATNPVLGSDPSGLDPDVSTAPNTAFFWSGRSNGVGAGDVVQDIAKSHGGTSLEMLLDKRKVAMPPWDASNPDTVKKWEDVSADYARGCSGTVHAVVGKDLRPNNVWENKELPALKKNPNVTKIIQIDPDTRAETVIFER